MHTYLSQTTTKEHTELGIDDTEFSRVLESLSMSHWCDWSAAAEVCAVVTSADTQLPTTTTNGANLHETGVRQMGRAEGGGGGTERWGGEGEEEGCFVEGEEGKQTEG